MTRTLFAATAGLLLYFAAPQAVGSFSSGDTGPNGEQPTTDLVKSLRQKNVGGRDGAGLCVFTSIAHAARYQNEPRLKEFQTQMRKEPGGGWPEKVDAMIAKYGKGSAYVQHTGGDAEFLEAGLKTGRMAWLTYAGFDPNYGMRAGIDPMVNCIYLDEKTGAILDNNFIEKPLFMSRDELLSRWRARGGGWAGFLLAARPMPVPKN